ncbi:hypothetical protein, partial [Vibrio alfacsensis]
VDTGQADSGNWNSVNVNQHGNDNTSSIIVGDVTKPRELTLNHNVQGDSNTLNSSINANGRVSSSLMVNGNGNTIGHTVNISDTTQVNSATLNLNAYTNSSNYTLNQMGAGSAMYLDLYGDATSVTTNVNQYGENAYASINAQSLPDNATIN